MAEIAGLKLIVPTSVSSTSGTTSIIKNGKIVMTNAIDVSVNGVFSAQYDNYLAIFMISGGGGDNDVRLRLNGTDSITGYTYQFLYANGTSITASRGTSQSSGYFSVGVSPSGSHAYFYGPHLAQPTAIRTTPVSTFSGTPRILDNVNTHSVSSSYDGFTFLTRSTATTGTIQVFGFNQ